MNYALKYAADGFAVFPVYEPICAMPAGTWQCTCGKSGCKGKHPRTPNGCIDATTDTETIKEWWTKWPNASIGGATGKKSGLAVVDLDGLSGIRSGNLLKLRSFVTSLTGNGLQLFYADPQGILKNSVKKIAEGLDTRGEGGYVILPPSLHPNGKRYCWENQPLSWHALPSIPPLFTTQRESPAAVNSTIRKASAPNWIDEAIAKLREGHVHNNLISILGKFRTANFSEEATYALLKPHALESGRPYEGLRDKIAEIWKRYQPAGIQEMQKTETISIFLRDLKEPEWICKPFIAKKSLGFVVGLPAVHKTWALMDLAIECARPSGSWFGLFPVLPSRVLFIDQERFKGETQRRFSAMIVAKGLALADLENNLHLKCGTTIRLDLQTSFDAFRKELLDLKPDIVLIDSFATIHSSQENDRTAIQQVLEKIKLLRDEIGCAFAMINHENKMAYPGGEPQGEPTMGTMVGSIGIAAAAEFILTVRKVDDITAIVHHVKSTLATSQKAFYFSTVDENNGTIVKGMA